MKPMGWTIQVACILGLVALPGCASTTPPSISPTRLGTSQDQATIQTLHRRLHERERTIAIQNYQIEIMASQLDVLKRIDQDTKKQWQPVRNSRTAAP